MASAVPQQFLSVGAYPGGHKKYKKKQQGGGLHAGACCEVGSQM